MSQEDLRVVVNDLSARLVQAEDHIKQLLQLTALLQSELSEQRNVIKSHFIVCNGSQHVYERANIQSASQQTYGALAAGSNVTAQPGQPLDESWVFNDNMDIDWDALDVLNIETSPEITPTNPIDAPQLPTFVAPVGNGQQYPISTHKHARDEDGQYGGSVDNGQQEIKAMRYDSLDRILAYTVQASSVSDKNLVQVDASVNYDEERKAISSKIFRYMNVGDMNALSKLVSEYFCDSLVMHYCQISDDIHGKAEAMMLFSLLYESYPDGVWKVVNTEVQGKVVTFTYIFTGTSVFDVPVAVSYHQVKEHERTQECSENSEESVARQIVRNIAEYNPQHQSHLPTGKLGIGGNSLLFRHTPGSSLQNLQSFTGKATAASGIASSSSPTADFFDISAFTVYDKVHTPHCSDCESPPPLRNSFSTTASTSVPAPAAVDSTVQATKLISATSNKVAVESDIIKIPRSKGNESFRLDGRAGSFTLGSDLKADFFHTHAMPTNHNHHHQRRSGNTAELMANALIRKSEMERRKCEITFNDYNLIVQIVISSCVK